MLPQQEAAFSLPILSHLAGGQRLDFRRRHSLHLLYEVLLSKLRVMGENIN